MIKKLLHVAIAVKSTAEWESLLRDQLGLKVVKSEDVPAQGVKGTIFAVGDSEIETLEPIDPQGTVARFVERRGEGFHHICFEVDSIDATLRELQEKEVELIDKQARDGLAGRIGFIHPRPAKGTLIELAQTID